MPEGRSQATRQENHWRGGETRAARGNHPGSGWQAMRGVYPKAFGRPASFMILFAVCRESMFTGTVRFFPFFGLCQMIAATMTDKRALRFNQLIPYRLP
jgi:hypothetical protein